MGQVARWTRPRLLRALFLVARTHSAALDVDFACNQKFCQDIPIYPLGTPKFIGLASKKSSLMSGQEGQARDEPIAGPIPLVTTYSLSSGSYSTQAHDDELQFAGQLPSRTVIPNEKISGKGRGATFAETLPTRTITKGGKANCLPTCLLGATMVTSILNTLLLSFIIKSIQLNDVSARKATRPICSPYDCPLIGQFHAYLHAVREIT